MPIVVKIRDHKARADASARRGIAQKIIADRTADIANDADAAHCIGDNVRDAVAIHIGKLPAAQVGPVVGYARGIGIGGRAGQEQETILRGPA